MNTKLDPAPLKYPNGGGIKAMFTKRTPKSQKLEVEALKKKHEAELARLQEKHSKVNSSKKKTK